MSMQLVANTVEWGVEPSQELILLNHSQGTSLLNFQIVLSKIARCICQNCWMYLSKLLNVFVKLAKCICSECWVWPSQELILLNHSPVTSLSFWGKHISAALSCHQCTWWTVAHCRKTSTRILSSRPEYVWRSIWTVNILDFWVMASLNWVLSSEEWVRKQFLRRGHRMQEFTNCIC